MYNMAYDALETARDWISPDNYVYWEVHDPAAAPGGPVHILLRFSIFPTALSGVRWKIFNDLEWNDAH